MARIAVVACALALAGLAALPPRAAADSAKPEVPPGSRYVLGKPFQFDGVWYRPAVDYDYDATGLAVVYDPGFAGGRTTNGEIYDGKALTAAHKTLPLPSLVQVTNLDNGRVVTVRVNDRGPFVDDQVIQLSGAAAAALGIAVSAPARVRVQVLAAESRALAQAYGAGGDAAPSLAAVPAPQLAVQPLAPGGAAQAVPAPAPAAVESTTAGSLPAATPPKPASANPNPPAQPAGLVPAQPAAQLAATGEPVIPPDPPALKPVLVVPPAVVVNPAATQTAALPPQPPAGNAPAKPVTTDQLLAHAAGFFVQTGAFANPADAEKLRAKLASLGQSKIVTVPVGALSFSAVLIGPIGSLEEARRKLAEVAGLGYKDAVLIAQ